MGEYLLDHRSMMVIQDFLVQGAFNEHFSCAKDNVQPIIWNFFLNR